MTGQLTGLVSAGVTVEISSNDEKCTLVGEKFLQHRSK